MYGATLTIQALLQFHHKMEGAILMVCNGEMALHHSFKSWSSNNRINSYILFWQREHVKGHQDLTTVELSAYKK